VLNCRTSSSVISGNHADFHEGHGTVEEWQGHGMESVNEYGMAWAWHDVCELAFRCGENVVLDSTCVEELGSQIPTVSM
jgi:hypothetical protein